MMKKRRPYRKIEEATHKAVCDYLKLQYPHVVFHSDASGLKLPIGQATVLSKLKSEKSIPDLFIAQPNSKYAGIYIEIKKDKSEVFTAKGNMRRTKHIQDQWAMLQKLRSKGYQATFGLGFDGCKKVIDAYLNEK